MVEVEGPSGFWLACGQLCSVISVVVPVAFALVVVVVLLMAAWKLSRAVLSAVMSAVREKNIKNICKRVRENVKKLYGWG